MNQKIYHRQEWLRSVVFLTIFLCFFMSLFSGCDEAPIQYNPGVYTNEAKGYYSDLIIEVTVDERQILDITIVSHEEPEILSDIVFEKLPPRIIKKNNTDVDVISGATYTSKALIEAVNKALTEALIETEVPSQ